MTMKSEKSDNKKDIKIEGGEKREREEHLDKEVMEEVEKERVRLQNWIPSFTAEKYKERCLFRCRRLAKIRENLRMLAESYEE